MKKLALIILAILAITTNTLIAKSKNIHIVYYSKTGNTEKIATIIKNYLKIPTEKIIDQNKRDGFFAYFLSGKDAALKARTKINPIKNNPKNFSTLIIGTPVWAGTITPAVRTYLEDQKSNIKDIYLFTTSGGKTDAKIMDQIQEITTIKPKGFLNISEKELKAKNSKYKQKIIRFINSIIK